MSRVYEILGNFHRDSCYPEAMDVEVNTAKKSLKLLLIEMVGPQRMLFDNDDLLGIGYNMHRSKMLEAINMEFGDNTHEGRTGEGA